MRSDDLSVRRPAASGRHEFWHRIDACPPDERTRRSRRRRSPAVGRPLQRRTVATGCRQTIRERDHSRHDRYRRGRHTAARHRRCRSVTDDSGKARRAVHADGACLRQQPASNGHPRPIVTQRRRRSGDGIAVASHGRQDACPVYRRLADGRPANVRRPPQNGCSGRRAGQRHGFSLRAGRAAARL